jgi:hypothetical protein
MLPLFDKIPYSDGKNGNGKSDVSQAMREFVYQRDKRKCRYCGRTFDFMHIDHVYPKKYGGKTIPENLVTACAECNTRKGARIGIWPLPIGYFDNASKAIEDLMEQSVIAYQVENVLTWYYRIHKIGLYSGLVALVVGLFQIATMFINFNAARQFYGFFILVTVPLFLLAMASLNARGFLDRKLRSLTEKIKSDK